MSSPPTPRKPAFWSSAFWPYRHSTAPLPWLTRPGIALIVLLFMAPFWLVEVPPLIDIPGHMGAAAIEAAGPNSPLEKYFSFRWVFTLNIGDGVLMKLIGLPFGVLAAGWWSTVLATALYAGGCLAVIRAVNPRGGYGAGWALVYVFSFPLLTGFLNFILATGISLIAFALSVRLEAHPNRRAALLIVLQPVAMLCHAIGGLLLALLVLANAFGREIDGLPQGWWRPSRARAVMAGHDWRAAARRLAVLLWPLVATVVTIVLWKVLSPPPARSFNYWRWTEKEWYLLLTLRDQSMVLDYATTIACYGLIALGWLIGGRWTWARLLPGLTILIEFVAIPSDINGSNFVDVRLLPVACMLLLGLMDWSGARPRVAWAVAYSGMVLLAVRLVVTAASFADYADDFRTQLAALQHIDRGSRVLAFVEHSCLDVQWRNTRRDHLASLASIYRQAWVNDNWAVPGLHMVVPRFRPGRNFSADPSEFVWSPRCGGGRLRSVDSALKFAPIERVDYVWLIDTGMPQPPDPRLQLIWQSGRSMLFAVRPLAIANWQPRGL